MGREQHRNRRAHFGAELAPGRPQPLGKGLGKQRMPRPAFGKVDAQAGRLGLDGAAVKTHAGAGVLRRHADDRGLFHAVGAHLADHIGNVRTPVSHANVDRDRAGLAAASSASTSRACSRVISVSGLRPMSE